MFATIYTNINEQEKAAPCGELRTVDAIILNYERTLKSHRSSKLLISPKSVVRGATQDLGSV